MLTLADCEVVASIISNRFLVISSAIDWCAVTEFSFNSIDLEYPIPSSVIVQISLLFWQSKPVEILRGDGLLVL